MGIPQSPSTISTSPHMYPQALQVKLYQAFIFSIPILFSIILFLLFYLFYLKRRSSVLPPPPPPILPRTFNHARPLMISSPCEMGLKGELQEKLPKVVFNEDLRERDSLCCVCLGEFEMKEELVQVPSCKHLFHADCIHHWFQSNTTCPLCRCSVLSPPPDHHSKLLLPSSDHHQINNNNNSSNNNHHHHHHQVLVLSSVASTIPVEAPSASTSSISTSRVSHDNEMDQPFALPLHIHVQNS